MTREGQDGINTDAAGMDHNIPVVAYYIDSPSFTWTPAEIAMFPHSVHVRIAVRSSTRDGHVIDRETGDATPAQAAQWAHQRRVDGYPYPIVYTSISNQGAVIAAFNAIHEPLPGWWLAHYDNLDVLPAGALGKQYADPGPLDKSIWADYIPGVDTVTAPTAQQIWAATISFTNSNGTVVEVPAETVLEFADLYAGQAVVALNDPATGLKAISAQLTAIQGALSSNEAALLAAVQGVQAGTVNVANLAQALVPLLAPADATAFLAAYTAQLNKA